MTEKTLPERLREFAQWIEDGREIQLLDPVYGWVKKPKFDFYPDNVYRAKPEKPQVIHSPSWYSIPDCDYVQITPEVREVLEKEGLL